MQQETYSSLAHQWCRFLYRDNGWGIQRACEVCCSHLHLCLVTALPKMSVFCSCVVENSPLLIVQQYIVGGSHKLGRQQTAACLV